MITQPIQDRYQFNLARAHYQRIRGSSVLLMGLVLLCASLLIMAGVAFWGTYSHELTPYLKWQDALVAMLWFSGGFVGLGISILIGRFMHALRSGYQDGMVVVSGQSKITVRDLSAENLKSIFWIGNSAFWCFLVVLLGLTPVILIGWTLKLPGPVISSLVTGIAILLSVAGGIISIVAAFFIVVAVIGVVPFTRKLGSSHTYKLNEQATVRIDGFVLTITYPGMEESMVDLNLLSAEDQQELLALLRRYWLDAQQVWGRSLGDEIAQALALAQAS